MPRQARGDLPAGIYHVTVRSAGPIKLYRDDDDRTMFCTILTRALARYRWTCNAFCLMKTHLHLVLDVAENALQPGMQYLMGNYARSFNRRHGRVGHLVGSRYYCARVESDGHMLSVLRYLARNPVEAGYCAKPSDWYWGSYRDCVELDSVFSFVDSSGFRSYFGHDRAAISSRIREFVDDGA